MKYRMTLPHTVKLFAITFWKKCTIVKNKHKDPHKVTK